MIPPDATTRFIRVIVAAAMITAAAPRLATPSAMAAGADAAPPHLTLDLGGGSAPIEFIHVKPGTFRMGCKGDEPFEHRDDGHLWSNRSDPWAGTALPVHEVTLTRGYYLGKFEITRGQFAVFIQETGFKTVADDQGFSMGGTKHGDWRKIKGANWADPKCFSQDDTHPATCIGWHDAVAFCKWAGDKTGHKIRLPTEAEWEYACRAGTETRWASGGSPPAKHLATVSWHMAKYVPGWEPACGTRPVGSLKANAWGFRDMHGNVWEWCADYYKVYPSTPRTDPQNKDFPGVQYWHKLTKDFVKTHWGEHRPSNGRRVLRGGSWCSQAPGNRSGFRRHEKGTNHLWYFGFRVVAEKLTGDELARANARRLKVESTPEAIARRRRLAEEQRAAEAATDAAKARAAREERSKRKRDRATAVKEAATVWDTKLLARVREALAAKQRIRCTCRMVGGRAEIRSVDGAGRLVVTDYEGGMQLPLALSRLSHEDRASLAQAVARRDHPADQAIAAFFALAAGSQDRGKEALHKAGDAGKPVRELFEGLGDL
ncbi:MAG: formylglycine-generating enzyme family protein [Planctomycetota bacterium]|jgi:formylglycine-generating enzyme required for sulfatase activity